MHWPEGWRKIPGWPRDQDCGLGRGERRPILDRSQQLGYELGRIGILPHQDRQQDWHGLGWKRWRSGQAACNSGWLREYRSVISSPCIASRLFSTLIRISIFFDSLCVGAAAYEIVSRRTPSDIDSPSIRTPPHRRKMLASVQASP